MVARNAPPELKRAYQAAWRATHRDAVNASKRAYRLSHRGELRAKGQIYDDTHREERKAYYAAHRGEEQTRAAARYILHREEVKARSAAYQASHPEQAKAYKLAWYFAHREQVYEQVRRRRARLAGNGIFTILAKDWRRMLARFRNACAYCGATGKLHQEHVIPLARGGRHSIGNLVPACAPCNLRKNKKLLVEWRHVGGRAS